MKFPLNFSDVSLWLAFAAIVLLITSEMLSFSYGKTHFQMNRKRLRRVALMVSILFLTTLVIRIVNIILAL